MAITSAWFIGSVTIGLQSFTVNGTPVSVAAGTYYLSDPTSALSLLAKVQTAMLLGAAGSTAVLLGSGKVRLAATGALVIVWGAATLLRDLLGFTGGLALATAYVAPNYSTLWWSPGKPGLFALSPLNVTGSRRHIVSQSTAAYTGKAESTSHGSRLFQRFTFEKVASERLKASDTDTSAGGEYDAFYSQVAVRSGRFKVYSNANEDSTSTTAFTYDTVVGPYTVPLGNDASWQYQRAAGHTWTDYTCDISITANSCPEIS